MAEEGPSWSKLTELVTNHVFIDVHWNELFAIVYSESHTNKIWQNSRTAAPSLNDFSSAFVFLSRLDEEAIDEWTLFNERGINQTPLTSSYDG